MPFSRDELVEIRTLMNEELNAAKIWQRKEQGNWSYSSVQKACKNQGKQRTSQPKAKKWSSKKHQNRGKHWNGRLSDAKSAEHSGNTSFRKADSERDGPSSSNSCYLFEMNQDSVHMLSYASSRMKLIQIICGFVIWSLLCTQWGGSLGYGLNIDWSSDKCSEDYRLYFCAAMSLAVLVFMISWVVLSLPFDLFLRSSVSKLSLLHANLERMLSVVFYILNSAAIVAIMWYWLANSDNPSHISISLILCIMQFVIGMVDVKCSFVRFRVVRNNL